METEGYSGQQVTLHWAIAFLIGAQYLFSDAMETSWNAVLRGQELSFSLGTQAHVVTGILVLLLAIPRLGLRLRRGAPKPPADEPAGLARIARLTHVTLYAIIFLMPISGLMAWMGHVREAGFAHGLLGNLLLVVVALHFAGALYHHFILRSNVLRRMLRGSD